MAGAKTIILITGANSGIGKVTAKLLTDTSADYHVIIGSRSLSKGQQAIDEIQSSATKGTLSAVELDVLSEPSIQAAAASISTIHGRLDVLINNAGIGGFEASTVAAKTRACFETNALGAVLVTEAFRPLILQSLHGQIIFVSSAQSSIGLKLDPDFPWAKMPGVHYRMSKAAMNMAMACYQVEFRDKGVVVQAMCPGYVHTNLRREREAAQGALPAETSAEILLEMVRGERDGDVTRLIGREGVYPW